MEGGKKKRMVEALVMSSLNTGRNKRKMGGVGAPAALRGAQIMPLEV